MWVATNIHLDQPSSQGKKKLRAETGMQGVQCTQAELSVVMPKIPNEVKIGDNMVGWFDDLKYSNHNVSDDTKFPYLAV